MMKVNRIKSDCYHFGIKIEDGEDIVTIKRPKCRCMSCEDLVLEYSDDEETRRYDMYSYDNSQQVIDDLASALLMVTKALAKELKKNEVKDT